MKKWLIRIGIFLLLLFVLFLLRTPILRGVGNYLIYEQPLEQADAILVLGGNSLDRGKAAAAVYHAGYAPQIVTTSANVPRALEIIGKNWPESRLAKKVMVDAGVPPRNVLAFEVATSTKEEGEYLLKYAKEQGYKKVILISDKFHLRRVKGVFEEKFEQAGIRIVFHGAPNAVYDEAEWWETEEGMIFVNNEYMKLLYYALKY